MSEISRRDFLHKSGAMAAGCAFTHERSGTPTIQSRPSPRIKRYKPLGKTGWNVGDISAGSGQGEPALIEYQVQQGINLLDTAFKYSGHEELIGKVLPKFRQKVFVIDKWDPALVTPHVTKAKLLEQLDVCLKRLNTTYIDCMMVHGLGNAWLGDIRRIKNPAIYEAYDEAKKLGKVRFAGASGCGPKLLEEMEWGIDNERFEMILCSSNFLTHGLETVVKKARAKGIATMAMKVMAMLKSEAGRGPAETPPNARQAVIKYMLTSGLFDTIIIGMRNYSMVDECLAVSGAASLNVKDGETLEYLAAEVGTKYCRPGCYECFDSCPHDVPIWDIMRYKMYFENHGDRRYAMASYSGVPASKRATHCSNCDAPCERNCSFGVRIRSCLVEAHKLLTLT